MADSRQIFERPRTRDTKALRKIHLQFTQLRERLFAFNELRNGANTHCMRHTVDRRDLREIRRIAQDIENNVAGYLEIIDSHPLQQINGHRVAADSAQREQATVWLELTDEVGDLRLMRQCLDLGKFEADVGAMERVERRCSRTNSGKSGSLIVAPDILML